MATQQPPSQVPWASRPPPHMRSRSPPDMAPQGSYDSSRMRSRSPARPSVINERANSRPRTPPESVSALQQWQQRFPAEQNRKSYGDYDPGYPTTVSPPRRSPPRRSPPRRWAEEPPQSRGYPAASRSPPRIQMNSPPQPRRWSPEPTQ